MTNIFSDQFGVWSLAKMFLCFHVLFWLPALNLGSFSKVWTTFYVLICIIVFVNYIIYFISTHIFGAIFQQWQELELGWNLNTFLKYCHRAMISLTYCKIQYLNPPLFSLELHSFKNVLNSVNNCDTFFFLIKEEPMNIYCKWH